jgi:putative ABC transport system substrate-binding protein
MRRRELVAGVAALLVAAQSARSQPPRGLPIVALLNPSSQALATLRADALRTGLGEAGLVEGTHYAMEVRFAAGRPERLPALAQELHSLHPAVFVASGTLSGVLELQPRPPIVFAAIALDPVEWGLVESYVRPGGMMTGTVLNALGGEDTIAEKRVTLFKECVPGLTRLGMFGSDVQLFRPSLFEKELRAAIRVSSRLRFEVREYGLKKIDDLEPALASAARDGIDGIYLSGGPLLISNLSRVMPSVLGAGKPTIAPYLEFARAGIMMSYSADLSDSVRRAGIYAGKVLLGAKPGDLPIQQPTRFTLAINAKTAQQLGIGVPPTLLAQADEVIE